MWLKESSDSRRIQSIERTEAPLDASLPFDAKKYNNGFVLYETNGGSKAETDRLCKLREMASAVRRRRLVTRAITYVALTIVTVLVLAMELAMKGL